MLLSESVTRSGLLTTLVDRRIPGMIYCPYTHTRGENAMWFGWTVLRSLERAATQKTRRYQAQQPARTEPAPESERARAMAECRLVEAEMRRDAAELERRIVARSALATQEALAWAKTRQALPDRPNTSRF